MPLAAFPKCFIEALCHEKEMTVREWIGLCDQFDIDGLEFYTGFAPLTDLDRWKRFGELAAQHGRSVPMLCHSSDFTHPEKDFRRSEIQKQKQAIDAAVALGSRYCRILTGQRRPGLEREEAISWIREAISECVDYASERGIVLNLENHYKDGSWLYPEFAQKRDAFLEVLSQAPSSPWFGVNYDPSNAVIAGEDPIELLERVKDRVVTMHASDRYFKGGTWEDLKKEDLNPAHGYASILHHGVIGAGLNDYDRIFSILKDAGFAGWISIEDGPDPATGVHDIRESAVFLRRKMKEHGLP